MEKLCEKCGKKVYAKGLCQSCYNVEYRKNKKLNKEPPPKSIKANFVVGGENAEEVRYITDLLNVSSTQNTMRMILDVALNDVPQQFIYDALRRRKNNA